MRSDDEAFSLEGSPDLELDFLDSIARLAAHRDGIRQTQGSHGRDPAQAKAGGNPQFIEIQFFVAGKGTLQDELLQRHGFRNASADYGLASWGILPLETLMRNPPTVIFMPTSAQGEDARALTARQRLLRHLDGKTRIVDFPDKMLFCGGPTIVKVSAILSKTRASLNTRASGVGQ